MAHVPAPSDQKFDAHFAAVGRLVDRWAHLEHQIDRAIWATANVEQMFGACITAQMIGVNGRLRALHSLLTLRGASDAMLKKLRSLAGSLGPLQIKRNRAAHDPRMVHVETQRLERLELTADNNPVFGFQPEDTTRLIVIAEEIGKKIDEFHALFKYISDEVNSLPDTSRPQLRRIVAPDRGRRSSV